MIEYIASLFTPTLLFCVLNLVIGTIFISSSFKPQKKQHQLGRDDSLQLTRVPSLLERVRSINYSFYPIADPSSTSQNAPPLAPSMFQRVCSLNFSPYRSEQPAGAFPLATHCADPPEREPQPAGGFPSATHCADQPDGEPQNEAQAINEKQQLKKSAGEKMEEEGKEDVVRRRPATAREKNERWSERGTSEGDETVDKKANAFINRFKQQLKLQRLESLLRETMQRRGGN